MTRPIDAAYRDWWYSIPGDVRDVPPPPGACGRFVRAFDGDPVSPCILAEDHDGPCQDVEGYTDA